MSLVFHDFNAVSIAQRADDGYVNATAMCQATDKLFADYQRLEGTQEFLEALSRNMGYPIIKLVESRSGRHGGSWVHPHVAVHLAQWCSPEFAVFVANLVFSWLSGDEFAPLDRELRLKELDVELERIKLERDKLRLAPSAPRPRNAEHKPKQDLYAVKPKRSKRPCDLPGKAAAARFLAVLSTDVEKTIEEIAREVGTSDSYARRSLFGLHRKKLVTRRRQIEPPPSKYIYLRAPDSVDRGFDPSYL